MILIICIFTYYIYTIRCDKSVSIRACVNVLVCSLSSPLWREIRNTENVIIIPVLSWSFSRNPSDALTTNDCTSTNQYEAIEMNGKDQEINLSNVMYGE